MAFTLKLADTALSKIIHINKNDSIKFIGFGGLVTEITLRIY